MFRAVLQDPAGKTVFDKFKINGTPTMMVLDGTGAEVDWTVGYRPPGENVQKALDRILAGTETYQALTSAYAKNSKDVATVFLLGRKYSTRYDAKNAGDKYREVIALDPEGKAGAYTSDTDKTTAPYTEFAEFYLARTGLEIRAKPDLAPMRAFLAKHPQSPLVKQAYDYMGYYYGYQAPKDEAAKFFAEYAAKYPADPMVLYSWLARIVQDKEPVDKGIELAAKIEAMTDFNPSPDINQMLAEAYALKGDKARVEELYGSAFMERRVTDLAFSLAGYTNYWVDHDSNLDSAVAMIETALKLEPDNTYIIQQAATAYMKTGKEERALAIYGPSFARKNNDDATALWQFASFWARQGKTLDDAMAAAKRSLELMPGFYFAWSTLSLVHEKMKNYPEAIKAAEKALEAAPEAAKGTYKKTIERLKAAQGK